MAYKFQKYICAISIIFVSLLFGEIANASPVVKPEISIIGDSIVYGYSGIYKDEFIKRGFNVVGLDALRGRFISTGWRCRKAVEGRTTTYHSNKYAGPSCRAEGQTQLILWKKQKRLGSIVVIALGTNDTSVPMRPSTYKRRLDGVRNIVENRLIILITVTTYVQNRQTREKVYNTQIKDWCSKDINCAIVDWAATPDARNRKIFTRDGIHHTRIGSAIRAKYIAEQTLQLIFSHV